MTELWQLDGRCVGVVTDRSVFRARATLVASGGAAALWRRTTNLPGAVGDGIAAAYRAGAAVADLEFVQFHPTTLVDSTLLLSEALRGEGAILLDEYGERFTNDSRRATSSPGRSRRVGRCSSTCVRSTADASRA